MTQTNFIDLPNIGIIQLRRIAKASQKTERYVRMVLNGERDCNSRTAKAILRGAKTLNKKIEIAQQLTDNKITSEID